MSTARGLGIGRGSTLFYDLEDYDLAPDDCRQAALSFVSGWTKALHSAGYRSGVYSNIAAAITSLDYADRVSPGSYAMPDDIWFAWGNGRSDVRTDSRVQGDRWDDHSRVHQYALDITQTFGAQTLQIDANWVDLGRGSVAPRSRPLCKGVDVDLRRYPTLRTGRSGEAVRAAQCLLRHNKVTRAPITGRYDARTAKAVTKAQRRLDLPQTGRLTARHLDGPAGRRQPAAAQGRRHRLAGAPPAARAHRGAGATRPASTASCRSRPRRRSRPTSEAGSCPDRSGHRRCVGGPAQQLRQPATRSERPD